MKFDEYGFHDLKPETLVHTFEQWAANDSLNTTLRYMSEKTGFNPDNAYAYKQGLDLVASYNWIDANATTANRYYCQSMKGKTD